MNFSYTKQDGHTKRCLVRAFNVNTATTDILFDQISNSGKFIVDTVFKINNEQHLILKEFSVVTPTY